VHNNGCIPVLLSPECAAHIFRKLSTSDEFAAMETKVT